MHIEKYNLVFKQMGTKSILINWPQELNDSILDDIIRFVPAILNTIGDKLTNHTPAYASLLLQYPRDIDFDKEKNLLLTIYKNMQSTQKPNLNHWHIPVCYDSEFAMDIETYTTKGISHKEVINLHTSSQYRVYMIGFLPGFIYLGGLHPALHMPRKKSPSLNIPKGSIAIGGQQTGIYPIDSPGGWHVIGRTPLGLFDIQKENPCLVKQGDYLTFYMIDRFSLDVLSIY